MVQFWTKTKYCLPQNRAVEVVIKNVNKKTCTASKLTRWSALSRGYKLGAGAGHSRIDDDQGNHHASLAQLARA